MKKRFDRSLFISIQENRLPWEAGEHGQAKMD